MTPWLRCSRRSASRSRRRYLKVLPPLIVLVFFIGGIAAVNLGLRRKVKDEGKGSRARRSG
jgi:hypothetical protein